MRKFFPDKFPCGSLADIEKEKETAANFFKHSNPIPKLLSGPLGFSAVGIQVQQLEGPWSIFLEFGRVKIFSMYLHQVSSYTFQRLNLLSSRATIELALPYRYLTYMEASFAYDVNIT